MSSPRLLPGPIAAEHVDQADELRQQLRGLRDELQQLRKEITEDKRQLMSILQSGRVVFGGRSAEQVADAAPTQDAGRWDKIKAQLGGKKAEVIDAILTYGPQTRSQLRVSTGSGMSTIEQALAKLKAMGLVEKQGDAWTLKGQ